MRQIYLDYAAATPMAQEVVEAMKPYFNERFYNPSATYLAAKAVKRDIEAARAKIAHWLGARPAEIVFTSGGTEANNLAINGVMQQFPGKKVLVSAVEHESVLAPARQYKYQEIPVDSRGTINLEAVAKQIDDEVVLISVMYANNEIGTTEPITKVARLIADIREKRRRKGNKLPLYLHTDACQAAAYLDLHTSRLGVDLITINGGKIYGPKQSGALYVKTGTHVKFQILGGGQEHGVRSGTENVAGIIGLATALDLVQNRRHEEVKRLEQLRDLFIAELTESIPDAVINGPTKNRLPNNIHLTIPGHDNERLIMALDEKGVICAAGSACSASKEESSHVLRAIGKTDAEAYASLRLTLGYQTSKSDVQQAVKTLADLV